MPEALRMWMEIGFNIIYLITIWAFVIALLSNRDLGEAKDIKLRRLFIWAFGLLALGDTGHVGFRVLAYAQGNLEATISFFGREIGLVGLGALSTAITVTFFYIIMLFVWSVRFGKDLDLTGISLIAVAASRFILMVPPQNEWNRSVPPQPWSLYRNLPLVVLGLGVAMLILQDATRNQDRPFKSIGFMILLSYAFYAPVILFVQTLPAIGMLMIPKTLAYVAIAWIAYRSTSPDRFDDTLTAVPD